MTFCLFCTLSVGVALVVGAVVLWAIALDAFIGALIAIAAVAKAAIVNWSDFIFCMSLVVDFT